VNGLESRRPLNRGLLWVVLVSVVVFYAFPFLYLLLTSFKTPLETLAVPPTLVPSHWTIDNYIAAWSTRGVPASFINSLTTACLSTVLSLAIGIPAAYSVTRFGTRFGQVFIMMALVVRMVPPVAIGIPLASTINALHLLDTPIGLAIAHTTISLPLSIWLMSSFFEAVPVELDEAAKVDGCSRLGALWRISVPVAKGGVAVTALFAFLASWNEFLFALLMTSVRAQTTPLAIANLQTQFGLDWGSMTALACMYSLPVIALTLVLQRHVVAGLTLGAVKG